jgi:uncharacterized membrane protein YphA (DoxX/SURF4 family)
MSRFQLLVIALALAALRISIGFHFFFEGTDKLKSGNFQASYFLGAAKGPLAPLFQQMLDDPSGQKKLCVVEVQKDGKSAFDVDPTLTLAIWDDYVDRATSHYGFGAESVRKQLEDANGRLADSAGGASSSVVAAEIAANTAALKQLAKQKQQATEILKNHQQLLKDWLSENRVELIAHFSTTGRLDGFQRDGASAGKTALEVEALRGQVDSIRSDRTGKLNQWSGQVVAIWDSLETKINSLSVGPQVSRGKLAIHRPFDQPNSKLKWINRFIPWFDTTVGVLLILGLFTTPAAIAAALFLASVVLTQPFWLPGTTPTYYQIVELAGLLVVAAAGSANTLGLDYFLGWFRKKRPASAGVASTTAQPTPQSA